MAQCDDLDGDLGDGFGNRVYARESAGLNERDGHQYNCAWAGGGDCTCGLWAEPESEAPSSAPYAPPLPADHDDPNDLPF